MLRSKLNLPGDRPDLIADAVASAADCLSFDLQDSVAPARKDVARREIPGMVDRTAPSGKAVIVRVNGWESGRTEGDLDAVVRDGVDHIVLPEAESPDDVRRLSDAIAAREARAGLRREIGLIAMIESPRGLRRAAEIACAGGRIGGLLIGYADLFEPFGIDRRSAFALAGIRLAVRMAAAEDGLPIVMDGVYMNLARPEEFREDAQGARELGLTGKSCKNDEQIAIANSVFSPTPAQVDFARRVVTAAETAFAEGRGLFEVDGRLIDRPFVEGARRTLAAAEAIGG